MGMSALKIFKTAALGFCKLHTHTTPSSLGILNWQGTWIPWKRHCVYTRNRSCWALHCCLDVTKLGLFKAVGTNQEAQWQQQATTNNNKTQGRGSDRRRETALISVCSGLAGKHNATKRSLGRQVSLVSFFPGFEVEWGGVLQEKQGREMRGIPWKGVKQGLLSGKGGKLFMSVFQY